jgi:PAS domain S-box-containing protein
VDCNPNALSFFGFTTKEDFIVGVIERLSNALPRFQPDGRSSITVAERLTAAAKEGYSRFETELNLGNQRKNLLFELVRIPYKNTFAIIAYASDVTEMRDRELELISAHETNERQLAMLNAVVKATKIGLWDIEFLAGDLGSQVNPINISNDLRQMLGYEKDEIPNTTGTWISMLHPDDKERAQDALGKHLLDTTGQTPYDLEYRLQKKNGKYSYFRVAGETMRDQDGKPIRIVGALMDVTETKNTIANNERQLMMLNAVVKATKIGLWEIGVVGGDLSHPENIFIWSEAFRKMLGYSDESDFPNAFDSWKDRLHPDDKEGAVDYVTRYAADTTGEMLYDVEYRLQKKSGEFSHFRAYGEAIRDSAGIVSRFAGALMDVTETKNTIINNELQLTKNNLMIKATKIGLWDMEVLKEDTLNPANPFNYSDLFRHMLGFENEDDFPNIIGSWSGLLHPDDKERTLDAFAKHLFDVTGTTPYDIEYQLQKKNGEYAYFRATGETIRDKDGNPIRVAGSLSDLTEAKNILHNTERLRREAESASKAKSVFLSHISHEIRTPMNAILGSSEIQLQKETLQPEVEEAFTTIYNSGSLLLNIINDILDISKIEASGLEIMPAKYDVPNLLYDTIEINLLRFESKPIKFNLDIDENMPRSLVGDELRIKQILNNLLSNAFKYTEKGEVELKIATEPDSKADTGCILLLRVRDTGQGMSQNQIEKLFDAYTRFNLEANRSITGTGLGMTITKQLVDLMKGEIIVASEPNVGSTFTVRLPQEQAGTAVCGAALVENLRKNALHEAPIGKKPRKVIEYMPYGSVLIVDDVQSNLYVAKGMMLPYGLKIEIASSGIAAVEKIKNGKQYDVIFMDHMMPEMDGMEAMKIIRQMGYAKPIVALTANAIKGQAEIFLASGFDAFIPKPIDSRELNALLEHLVRDKHPPEVVQAARLEKGQQKAHFTASLDKSMAAAFILDADSAISTLDDLLPKIAASGGADQADVTSYVISVHGMKSALANVGEKGLSDIAFKLEQAGNDGNIETISAETPKFVSALRSLLEKFQPARAGITKMSEGDMAFFLEKLRDIKAACEKYQIGSAKKALAALKEKAWPAGPGGILAEISTDLLRGNLKKIASTAETTIQTFGALRTK